MKYNLRFDDQSNHNHLRFLLIPREGPLTPMGFIEEPAAPLQPLPPLVGVIDLDIGVLGLSSIFLVDGVLALDEVPLRGL